MDEATAFADLVYRMTGDWYTEVDCAFIDDQTRGFGDEVIYLGDEEKMNEAHDEYVFLQMSLFDRYRFDDQ